MHQVEAEAFDEESYLQRYPDVARAVALNHFSSGYSHYLTCGFQEGRVARRLSLPAEIELPADARIASLPSPAFETIPPGLFNEQEMPADLARMYSDLWHQRRASHEIVSYMLSDVVVDGTGFVFDAEGRLYAHSARQGPKHEIGLAYDRVAAYLREPGRPAMPGVTLLCEKAGVTNYGHWLVEMLPVVHRHLDELRTDWHLRAPLTASEAMNRVIRDSIELLGVAPERIRWGSSGVPQRYERLVLVTGLGQHGAFFSPYVVEALDAIASPIRPASPRKIWISREGMTRSLIEEQAVCSALDARGWLIARPDTMSLREQISLFRGSEAIAGVNGAGLVNLAFAPSTARIISYVPARMPEIFFWMVANFKGQSYSEVRCKQESEGFHQYNWECRLLMDAGEVLRYIDLILNKG